MANKIEYTSSDSAIANTHHSKVAAIISATTEISPPQNELQQLPVP
jgi:hypothetical protein